MRRRRWGPRPEHPLAQEALELAAVSCQQCFGLGVLVGKRGGETICGCAARAAFRRGLEAWRWAHSYPEECAWSPDQGSFPRLDYAADFELCARRALSARELRCFKLHHLAGEEYPTAAPALGFDRGSFFHEVYRVERKVGLALLAAGLRPPANMIYGQPTVYHAIAASMAGAWV